MEIILITATSKQRDLFHNALEILEKLPNVHMGNVYQRLVYCADIDSVSLKTKVPRPFLESLKSKRDNSKMPSVFLIGNLNSMDTFYVMEILHQGLVKETLVIDPEIRNHQPGICYSCFCTDTEYDLIGLVKDLYCFIFHKNCDPNCETIIQRYAKAC